jgi:hypothetical protein
MTKLTKRVTRATGKFHRGDEIVIDLDPLGFVTVRFKGKPSSHHTIDFISLYERLAWDDARQAAERAARERRKR